MNARILLSTTLLLALAGCAGDPGEAVDELFAAYNDPTLPGAAVLVIQDGQKVLTRTYGVVDIATKDPVTSATNFRLASITKQFTAMAILLLVEDGKLSLNTTLGELYPEANDYAKGFTIRQILRHQSGMPDYEPMVPADGEQAHDEDVLALMLNAEEGYFPPGSEYRYSNSGYAVLAMIVEKLSGQTFPTFLDERIFTPLGMNNTVAFVKDVTTVNHRAFGYTVTEAGVDYTDQSAWSAVLGDGGVYSSLDDLYTWDQSLYRDDLVSPELKLEMFAPSLETYGYGWRIDEFEGSLRQHHSGSTSGFRNYLQRMPNEKLTVIVLTNRAEPDVKPLGEQVARLFL